MTIDRETQVLSDAYAAGIRSPKELANFMAQVTHESNGLNRLQESFRYTKGITQIPVEAAWRQGAHALDAARKDALRGQPEKLAELMYGGRNGNDEPGDGFRYHGRGYIPLTGRANYLAAGNALNMDLTTQPELAADPTHASKIAVWYWQNRVPEDARTDVRAATRAVNGKLNGLQDRADRFSAWEKRLTPEVMDRLASGEVGHPLPSPGHDAKSRAAREMAKASKRRLLLDDNTGPDNDPLIEMEQQRSVMEESGEFTPEPVKPHHRHRQAPGYGYAVGEMPGMCQAPMMSQPEHPHHALFSQARDAVHRLDKQHQRAPDTQSENLAAALTVAAHREGMQRIDHAALSDDASRAFVVQGDPASPLKRVAEVPTEQAVATPVEKSTEVLDRIAKAPQQGTEHPHQPLPHLPGTGHGM